MEQQMERYFGKVLDTVWELDPERLRNQLEYDAQTQDFRIRWPLESDWVLPGYRNGDRPWGKELESFQYNGDGTATAVISSEDLLNPGGEPLSRDFYTGGAGRRRSHLPVDAHYRHTNRSGQSVRTGDSHAGNEPSGVVLPWIRLVLSDECTDCR